jgi:hypothetical protein
MERNRHIATSGTGKTQYEKERQQEGTRERKVVERRM